MLKRTALLFCLAIAACASGAQPAAPLQQPTGWVAVLIAGDNQEPAFANAVDAMADKLEGAGVDPKRITVLKAGAKGAAAAIGSNIQRVFAGLAPAESEGCFVFMTSHGQREGGLVLAASRTYLAPSGLDRLLAGPCRDRPTVVIASGCFSGVYTDSGAMRTPNRVILTAARRDRSSFGCNASLRFTVFDECILRAIDRGLPWQTVMDRSRACVTQHEEDADYHPASEPQLFIGQSVAQLTAFPR
ncbi:C13 family peptidase [Hypericibacter sp.]|uniref:C13 family peptidase n=1 Tax=Hypericibacter sp. TaxID=2705401 RepID=UPI003D6D8D25